MAFANLTEKFEQKMNELYQGSARLRSDGGTSIHPIIEIKPGNPAYTNYGLDSRTAPFRSVSTDFNRMTIWSKSPAGLRWYLDQGILQTGNVFEETRIFNPLFVIGNTQPFIHIKRPLSDDSNVFPSGPSDQRASDAGIGSAGRLQLETSRYNVGRIFRGDNNIWRDLIRYIPPIIQINALSGILNIGAGGTLGVNQRPELDFDNSGDFDVYYSAEVWKGFKKREGTISNLSRAASSLRHGDIVGAIRNIASVARTATSDADSPNHGMKYFILGKEGVRSYLKGATYTSDDGMTPAASKISYKFPFIVKPLEILSPGSSITLESVANSYLGLLDSLTPQIAGPSDKITKSLEDINLTESLKEQNPVQEQQMTDPQLSIKYQFDNDPDSRLRQFKDAFSAQVSNWRSTVSKVGPEVAGYGGGLNVKGASDENPSVLDIGAGSRFKNLAQDGRYFYDTLNSAQYGPSAAPFGINLASETRITAEVINKYRENAPALVDLFFFDFVNRVAIPFRAYISSLNETVQPEFRDTFYVGRSERNVVYVGAKRSVSFTLMVHAFNEEELVTIWRKINYLTGLCYPSSYRSGYMAPPLIKLTLGDIYNNQPGYIQAMSTAVDDDTTWEITPGLQVPHGVRINLTYAIIEKQQMSTSFQNPDNEFGLLFYAFGQPRSTTDNPRGTTSVESADNSAGLVPNNSIGANRGDGNSEDISQQAVNLINLRRF